MSRRLQENIVAGIVLLLFVAVVVISFDYGPRARLVPVPVAVLGIVLTLVQLFWQNTRPEEELHIDLLEVLTKDQVGGGSAPPPPQPTTRTVAAQVRGFAIVGAFLVMFLAFGPFPSIFLFVMAYLTVSRYSGIGLAFLMATALTLVLWMLFVFVLGIQVYWGLLEPLARALGL